MGARATFQPTQWSVVLRARQSGAPEAEAALETLCRAYWYPVYAFVRHQGHPPAEAQDLTQGFFAHLLEQPWLDAVGPEKGLFRTYLLRCLTHYLTNQWQKERALRRHPPGGFVPLDADAGEARYAEDAPDTAAPDVLFDRHWVMTLLAQVTTRLRAEYAASGRQDLIAQLEPHLGERAEAGAIAQLATSLGMTQGAVRVALHRLRHRFGEVLRETVAQTLANPADVDAEIRSLFAAWK